MTICEGRVHCLPLAHPKYPGGFCQIRGVREPLHENMDRSLDHSETAPEDHASDQQANGEIQYNPTGQVDEEARTDDRN